MLAVDRRSACGEVASRLRLAVALACSPAAAVARTTVAPPVPRKCWAEYVACANHAIIGFSVDTPERAAKAASEGHHRNDTLQWITRARECARKSTPRHSIVGRRWRESPAVLFYWECHRTHTVKPPPKSYRYNTYCRDRRGSARSIRDGVVLQRRDAILKRDATRPYVVAHWVLDDWPGWDPGSGRSCCRKFIAHRQSTRRASGDLRIRRGRCAARERSTGIPARQQTTPTAAATSSAGTTTRPSAAAVRRWARKLDWTMKALLPAMAATASRGAAGISRRRRSTASVKPGAARTTNVTISLA